MPSLDEDAPPLPPPPAAPGFEGPGPGAPAPALGPRAESFASAPSQPASELVRRALQPECSVDFPQITEICERLEIQPAEIRTTVAVLSKALRDRRQPLQVKLKALTIAHEMLYNPQVVQTFAEAEGLREALEALRQVRTGELGAAMDENVRMLSTEILGRCFEGKISANGWTSFAKAMSSDLEKARKAARKNLQHFSQKAEKQMEKAERVFESGATMLMQQAESMLAGPGPPPTPAVRGQDKMPVLTTEEEQLQWALRQSLREANRQNSGGYSKASAPKPSVAEDLPPEVAQADCRAAALEEALGAQLAAEDADAKETAQLSAKLEDAMKRAQKLATRLSKAEYELTTLKQRRESLEEQVLCMQSEQSHLGQLRERVAELEAQIASAASAAVAAKTEVAEDVPASELQVGEAPSRAETSEEAAAGPAVPEAAALAEVSKEEVAEDVPASELQVGEAPSHAETSEEAAAGPAVPEAAALAEVSKEEVAEDVPASELQVGEAPSRAETSEEVGEAPSRAETSKEAAAGPDVPEAIALADACKEEAADAPSHADTSDEAVRGPEAPKAVAVAEVSNEEAAKAASEAAASPLKAEEQHRSAETTPAAAEHDLPSC